MRKAKGKRQKLKGKSEDALRAKNCFLIFAFCLLPFAFRVAACLLPFAFLACAARPRGPLAYVTNERDGTITVIDTATDRVVSTFNLGGRLRGGPLGPYGPVF